MSSFNSTSLANKLGKIDALATELDALRPLSPEQEARVLQKFRLDWNYHSNSIEGNSLTYGETLAFLMEGLTAKGKPFKDHLDLKGHNEGINYLFDLVKNEQPLTEKVIRELHEMILVESYKSPAQTPDGQQVFKTVTLGAYKKLPNHVQTPTGEIHYYATPEETPAKMADLVHWLREEEEKKELHPVVVAAIFHYRFVAIHPFDDGNGRMSRLLMNLLLLQHRYPPAIIKQQERQDYFYALRQADAGELTPFVEFIAEHVIHSQEIQLRGARGESIEEEDDLDKEIALLKAGFTRHPIIQKKRSSETIQRNLEEFFLPLSIEITQSVLKLRDLFLSVDLNAGLNFNNNKSRLIPISKLLTSLKEESNNWNSLNLIFLRIELNDFNRARNPFSIERGVRIVYEDFHYRLFVTESNSYSRRLEIEKLYTEEFNNKEIKAFSKEFIQSILQEIKEKAGQ